MSESTVAERIKMLVEAVADKTASFLKATGLSHQNLHDLTSGRSTGPSYPTTTKILIAYPQVNERWLLLGEGEMLKPAPIPESPQTISSYMPPSVGETGIAADLRGHLSEEGGMPSYGVQLKPKTAPKRPKPVGSDLIEQVAQNTEDIARLLAAWELLSQNTEQHTK